jgi:hypothetical protein
MRLARRWSRPHPPGTFEHWPLARLSHPDSLAENAVVANRDRDDGRDQLRRHALSAGHEAHTNGRRNRARISERKPSAPSRPWLWHRGSFAIACSKLRRARRRRAVLCDLSGSRGRHRWFCRSKDRDALVGIRASPRGICIPSPRARWKRSQPRSPRCTRPASGRCPSAQARRGHQSRPPVEMIRPALSNRAARCRISFRAPAN